MFRSLPIALFSALLFVGCSESGTTPNATTSNSQESVANNPLIDEPATPNDEKSLQAVCKLVAIGDSGVTGTIHFTSVGNMVQVRGDVAGLTPGEHGFHVHEKGDLSDKETGKSTGGHFNPTDKPHGRPSDTERHVGDLGNIVADGEGKATIMIDDAVIKLSGENSIMSRGIVIHADPDQFTQPTGDAGGRVAFGTIELDR